jgi:hypothetical protein
MRTPAAGAERCVGVSQIVESEIGELRPPAQPLPRPRNPPDVGKRAAPGEHLGAEPLVPGELLVLISGQELHRALACLTLDAIGAENSRPWSSAPPSAPPNAAAARHRPPAHCDEAGRHETWGDRCRASHLTAAVLCPSAIPR